LKNSRRYVSILAVLFAISISLAAISGCSQNVVAPIQDNPDHPKIAGAVADWDTVLTMQTDKSGGKVSFTHNGEEIDFKVLPKALPQPTLITIKCHLSATERFGWAFDCSPEGTIFAVPLQLTAKKKDGSTYKTLYYYDESKGAWTIQESIDGVKKLHFDIYHFSKYGIEASLIPTDFGVDDGGSSQ
jgi:hypothetical protein